MLYCLFIHVTLDRPCAINRFRKPGHANILRIIFTQNVIHQSNYVAEFFSRYTIVDVSLTAVM